MIRNEIFPQDILSCFFLFKQNNKLLLTILQILSRNYVVYLLYTNPNIRTKNIYNVNKNSGEDPPLEPSAFQVCTRKNKYKVVLNIEYKWRYTVRCKA